MSKISVIIPAYNEEDTIARAIDEVIAYFRITKFDIEVIVVDDGSTDKTSVIVQGKMSQHPLLKLIKNEKNMGKGFSVKRGVLAANGDWILFMDADLSTRPEEFNKFRPCLEAADICIGSRAVIGAKIVKEQPLFRRFARIVSKFLIKSFTGIEYSDTQCGFKAFNRNTFKLFEEQQTGKWMFDLELLVRAKKHGFKVVEVPILWFNDATSTVKIGDFWGIIKDLSFIRKIRN